MHVQLRSCGVAFAAEYIYIYVNMFILGKAKCNSADFFSIQGQSSYLTWASHNR